MTIDHLGIWAIDLEAMRSFYVKYFNMSSGEKYINANNGFSSYFLSFDGIGVRLEIMHKRDMDVSNQINDTKAGLAHLAIAVGSELAVNNLTERLRADNYFVKSEPRKTGDGYYESIILDPEGNLIEICA